MALALTVAVGGTLMLFTDVSEVGTNVVTMADEYLSHELQEKGGEDLDPADGYDTYDIDGDGYWEYSKDYTTITPPSGNFLGIEYPPLLPKTVLNKAPRVLWKSGVDAYVRVLARVNIYEINDDGTTSELVPADNLPALLGRYFIIDNESGLPNLDEVDDPDDDSYFSILNTTTSYQTFGDYVAAVLSGVNTNQVNWEFVPISDTEGIYYYVSNAQNPELTVEGDTASGPNASALAVFNGSLTFSDTDPTPATAPLFTEVIVPNFTNEMGYILKNYRLAIQFQSQEVQVQNNEFVAGGSQTWADVFSELPSSITVEPPIASLP
jgi:predicted ribosomally synthesized peptide with SipW-like signal peptide